MRTIDRIARVEKYLVERAKVCRLDSAVIHSLHPGDPARDASLRVSDLQALIRLAKLGQTLLDRPAPTATDCTQGEPS